MTAPPKISEIRDSIVTQMEISLGQTIPSKAFLRVLATVLAGVFSLVYRYAAWIGQQTFVGTAAFDETTILGTKVRPLVEWGRLIGVGDPIPASQAELTAAITVTNQTGSLPGYTTQLICNATGVGYILIDTVPLDAATVYGTIRATSDKAGNGGAGEIGNLEVGDELTFVTPVANVSRTVEVSAIEVTAADAETEAAYRQRILDRFQARPQGGSYADYASWAESVTGIANAYPYTGDPGEVNLYVESSTETDGIPSGAQLTAVEDYIETVRPVNVLVNVLPITRYVVDVDVLGMSVSGSQTDVETALTEYMLTLAPFIEGLTVPPRRDQITVAGILSVVNDIVSSAGGTVSGVVLYNGGNLIYAHSLAEGEKAKIGTVTFDGV